MNCPDDEAYCYMSFDHGDRFPTYPTGYQRTTDPKLILIGPQFFGKNHSWAVCGLGWLRGFLDNGHRVHIFSTDGIEHLPDYAKPYLIGYRKEGSRALVWGREPRKEYDMQIAYTAPPNWKHYFQYTKDDKNRFACWCYEWSGKNVLPNGFAKMHVYVDKVVPPCEFAKQVFLDSGVPEHKLAVIPHGVGEEFFLTEEQIAERRSKWWKP